MEADYHVLYTRKRAWITRPPQEAYGASFPPVAPATLWLNLCQKPSLAYSRRSIKFVASQAAISHLPRLGIGHAKQF